MGIWTYNGFSRDTKLLYRARECPFCKISLVKLKDDYNDFRFGIDAHVYNSEDVHACQECGWWKIENSQRFVKHAYDEYVTIRALTASLKELDLQNIDTPVEEIKQYLSIKNEKRFSVNPKLFEEVVASVFRDLGYNAITTAYSNDGGIDIFLDKAGTQIGVQVKRYKNAIKVEQIRSLAGALVYNGLTKGIFVTTSNFQSGGVKVAEKYKTFGYEIDLMDGDKLMNDLQIAQRKMYTNTKDLLSSIPTDYQLIKVDDYEIRGGDLLF